MPKPEPLHRLTQQAAAAAELRRRPLTQYEAFGLGITDLASAIRRLRRALRNPARRTSHNLTQENPNMKWHSGYIHVADGQHLALIGEASVGATPVIYTAPRGS